MTTTPQTITDPWQALSQGGMLDTVGLIRLLHFSPNEVQRKIISGQIQLDEAAAAHFANNIQMNTAKQQAKLADNQLRENPSPAVTTYANNYLNDPLNQGILDYYQDTYGGQGGTPGPADGGPTTGGPTTGGPTTGGPTTGGPTFGPADPGGSTYGPGAPAGGSSEAGATPVTLWDAPPAGGGQPAPGIQTPNYGAPTQGQGQNPFPQGPPQTQQSGVGPANGMDNFNNAAHSTWKSQYEGMMQGLDQNIQNQQSMYPVGPRATRYGLLGDPYNGGGLI